MKTRTAPGILFAATLGLWACGGGTKTNAGSGRGRDLTFPTLRLTPEAVVLESGFPATLRGRDEVEIRPRLEGVIAAVLVEEGQAVRRGQPLFRLDAPAALRDLRQAEAAEATAALDVERTRPLVEKGVVGKATLAAYENALASARAGLAQARSAMDWSLVKSPVAGLVGAIGPRVGSLVSSADALTTVSGTSEIVAEFSLGQADLDRLTASWNGRSLSERIASAPALRLRRNDGGLHPFPGRVTTISGRLDSASGTVKVRALFPNPGGLLLSGASAQVEIPERLDSALTVPQKATFAQQDKIMAYVVQGDSAVQRVLRARPLPDGKRYVVDSGLVAGDRLVVDGLINLRDGQKIRVR